MLSLTGNEGTIAFWLGSPCEPCEWWRPVGSTMGYSWYRGLASRSISGHRPFVASIPVWPGNWASRFFSASPRNYTSRIGRRRTREACGSDFDVMSFDITWTQTAYGSSHLLEWTLTFRSRLLSSKSFCRRRDGRTAVTGFPWNALDWSSRVRNGIA